MELNIDGKKIRCHKNGKIECYFFRENRQGYWYHSNRNSTLITINKRNYKISHLISKAYNPDFVDTSFVYHKNGINTDNRLENLYFVERKRKRSLNGRFCNLI
jgi:hypothetical protein